MFNELSLCRLMYNSLCNHSLKCIMSYWLPNSFGLGWNCLQPLTSPESSLLFTACCTHLAPQKHLSHCTWIAAMRCDGYTGELKPHRFCSVSSATHCLCDCGQGSWPLCLISSSSTWGWCSHTLPSTLKSSWCWKHCLLKCKTLILTEFWLSLGATVYLKCYFLYFCEKNIILL